MKQVSDLIRTFFEDYERASNTFEQDLLARQFSDPYMAADPHGRIHVVKKDDSLAVITKRQALFHSLGLQFVKIVPPGGNLVGYPLCDGESSYIYAI